VKVTKNVVGSKGKGNVTPEQATKARKGKVKGKVTLEQATKAQKGAEV
jgi:hypothetical protein